MRIKRYNKSTDKEIWNQFIQTAKNSTFLFHRNFMDYHADRFADHSLMAFDEANKLVAVLPANISDEGEISSHQGLTYGGWVIGSDVKLTRVLSIFYYALLFLRENGIHTVDYKSFPIFYNSSPTDEIEYVLFLLNAELYRRDTAFVIDRCVRIPYSGNIRREGQKAKRMQAVIREEPSMEVFWNQILEPNLMGRFGVKPVHNLEEIQRLKGYFPDNIRQFNVYKGDEIMAGTTLFVTPSVAACQATKED